MTTRVEKKRGVERLHHLLTEKNEQGFTLMEVVITVAVILILSIGGFMAYEGFQSKARDAAVESAAEEVYTGASAHRINDPRADLEALVDEYNDSADGITAAISEGANDICVSAVMDGYAEHTAQRGDCLTTGGDDNNNGDNAGGDNTGDENAGDDENAGENNNTVKNVCKREDTPITGTGTMVLEWDIALHDDNTVELPIYEIRGDGLTVDWGDGTVQENMRREEVEQKPLFPFLPPRIVEVGPSHTYTGADASDTHIITIEGSFDMWSTGTEGDMSGLTKVLEWKGTGTSDLQYGFYGAEHLTHVEEIPEKVMVVNSMFNDATAFNQDVSDWDTSNVITMDGMFLGATAFNQDISDWDVSCVQSFNSMFLGATAFDNGGKALDWNGTGEMIHISNMFRDATSFNQDITSWDVDNVSRAYRMFEGATSFNQDLTSFDIPSSADVHDMFKGATNFNNAGQPLTEWMIDGGASN